MSECEAETRIYQARRILTMDENRPQATHVAVRNGRILAVGNRAEAESWGAGEVDDRYGDHVIVPGFVEGHSHVMAGGIWRYVYAGFH